MNTSASLTFRKSALALAIASISMQLPAFEIEEIVVTAQKREQSLQDVPISVNAFTEDFMQRAGVDDVRGLVTLTPGFSGATEDSFVDSMAMRGISTNDFGIGGDPSVAIFVDGVWAGRTGGVQSSFFDMAGAEVVKGPQGTLFGRNAIAGAVSIKTKKPEEEFGGKISVGLAEYDKYEFTGTINIPLTDKLFFRGSIYAMDEDGWLDNIQGGDDYGFHERSATRLALRYVGDSVEATVTASYEDREQNASVYWDPLLNLDDDEVSSDLLGKGSKDEGEIGSIIANVEIDLAENLTLTSITGWKTYNFFYLEDYDGRPTRIDNYQLQTDNEYWSQEFRFNFSIGDNIVAFAGLSYYEEEIEADTGNFQDEDALCNALGRTSPDYFSGPVTTGCSDPDFIDYWGPIYSTPVDNKYEQQFNEVESDGWGIFGDFTWSITDQLDIMYGIRYTEDNKEMSLSVPDSGGALGNQFSWGYSTTGFITDDESWDDVTQRLAANFTLNEEISIYGNYGQGYKSGGYATYGALATDNNGDFVADAGAKPLSFDPETVDSYEVGIKTKLLENTLQANVSLYYFVYEDLQLSYFDSGSSLVDNLGEAEATGLEIDIRYLPTEFWDIFFTLSWQDTEITDGDQALLRGACDAVCEGNELPYAPEYSAATVVTYRIPMDKGEVFITGEYLYQDDQFSDVDNIELISQDSWGEANLRAGFESADEWTVTLWIENVTSEEYFERGWANAGIANANGYGLTNTQVWPAKPRTVGLDFEMSF